MENYGFVIDNRKCIGCHACTVACKSEHDVPIGVNRTWVKYIEHGEFPDSQRSFSVMRCNHCSDAPCVSICPVTALYKRDDGIVDFDSDRCIGCKACTQACPYDALYIDPNTNTAAKCNYCTHRVEKGIEPACVVVCPEHAIISGDLNDEGSEISQLLAENTYSVRKAEKGTNPKLFYIDAQPDSLEPTAADAQAGYVWSSQSEGVGHNKSKPPDKKESWSASSTVSYDPPDKGVLWGWEVAAYLVTKGISGGVLLLGLLFNTLGIASDLYLFYCVITSLIFLGITGGLLVKDLDRPDRFLSILLRPQWKSWLVKGAYFILIYSILLCTWMAGYLLNIDLIKSISSILLVPFATLTLIYTAFLFAQAKGRDYWQNPALPLHMLVHGILLGAAFLMLVMEFLAFVTEIAEILNSIMVYTIGVHLALIIFDLVVKPKAHEAKLASKMIHSGKFASQFWIIVVLMGNIIPLILLLLGLDPANLVVAVFLILGTWTSNHILVKAPQLIPLS